ncbi:MAG: helix-turn-helix domain-containing protein [Bacteroidales bacterium]|nr:helix-turn-helix domain-containing protein [Bacteroidales bacterium]
METYDLNQHRRNDMPVQGTPATFDVHLQTFHHMLYDSLMPWLPENSAPLRYRVILPELSEESRHFFKTLLNIFSKRKILLAPLLKREWETFSGTPLYERPLNIYKSLVLMKVSHSQILFYQMLLYQSFLYSQSLFMDLMEKASEPIKRFLTNQWMKTLQDLRHRTHQLFEGKQPTITAIILFFSEMILKVMESEISHLYQSYCQPDSLVNSLNKLSSDHLSLAPNRDAAMALDQWYEEFYFPHYIRHDTPASEASSSESNISDEKPFEMKQKESGDKQNIRSKPLFREPDTREPEIIGTREVQQLLGIGKTKLLQMCHQGAIPCFRVGKLFKFRRTEIQEFRGNLRKAEKTLKRENRSEK